MKAILFVLAMVATGLIVAIGVSAAEVVGPDEVVIPGEVVGPGSWYYTSSCQQPEGATLHEWLGSLEQYGELEIGGWDCSQTSAYVEWLAENCAYEAVITCRRATSELAGHCWVTIEGDPYEATHFHWIDDSAYYTSDIEFENIHEAYDYLPNDNAWAWWLTYPILVEGIQ